MHGPLRFSSCSKHFISDYNAIIYMYGPNSLGCLSASRQPSLVMLDD